MNLDKHYGERTPDIRLDELTPYANSLPHSKMFLSKKYQKVIKKDELPIEYYMAVVFEKPQEIVEGQLMTWTLDDLTLNVYVLEHKQLFVRGKYVWAYAVGIMQ